MDGSHKVALCDGPPAIFLPYFIRVRLPRLQRAALPDWQAVAMLASCPHWQRVTPKGHPRTREPQG